MISCIQRIQKRGHLKLCLGHQTRETAELPSHEDSQLAGTHHLMQIKAGICVLSSCVRRVYQEIPK